MAHSTAGVVVFLVSFAAWGGGGYLAGRIGHRFGNTMPGLLHHWIPGALCIVGGAIHANPPLLAAGFGLVVSDWDDYREMRIHAPAPADLLPKAQRTFWGFD